MIIIPPEQLQPETLEAVLEEFVSREGTEYGAEEVPLARKVAQVKRQLADGRAFLCFDEESQSCNILSAREVRERGGVS
ncbi:MAG TPA: YheU family protein [Pseudomonadales bacterium]